MSESEWVLYRGRFTTTDDPWYLECLWCEEHGHPYPDEKKPGFYLEDTSKIVPTNYVSTTSSEEIPF